MPARRYSNRTLRTAARAVHLGAAVALVALTVAGSARGGSTTSLVTLVVALPVLGLTGLVMWRPARLGRLLDRSAGRDGGSR